MMLKIKNRPRNHFVQIPHNVIMDQRLWDNPSAMQVLQQLYCFAGFDRDYGTQKNLASVMGTNASILCRRLKQLEELGYVKKVGKDYELDMQPVGEDLELSLEDSQEVLEDLQTQPRREATGLSAKDRDKLILAAWNAEAEKGQYQVLTSLKPSHKMVIEAHGKRMGVERDDYSWITQVLMGGRKMERFFPQDGLANPGWVFGAYVDKITDWKFQQIEDAYRMGDQTMRRSKKYSDPEILAWYNRVAKHKQLKRVEWVDVKTLEEHDNHEEFHSGDGTLYLYNIEGWTFQPARWTNYYLFKCGLNQANEYFMDERVPVSEIGANN